MDSHPKPPRAPPTPKRTPEGDKCFFLYWDSDHWDIPRGQSLFQHIPTSSPRAVRLSRVAAASRTPWITTGIPTAAPGRDKTHLILNYQLLSPPCSPWERSHRAALGFVPEVPFVKITGNSQVRPGDTTQQRPYNNPYPGRCFQLILDFQRGSLIPEVAPGLAGVPQRHQPQSALKVHLEKDGNEYQGEGTAA